jgi:hypothetical protein
LAHSPNIKFIGKDNDDINLSINIESYVYIYDLHCILPIYLELHECIFLKAYVENGFRIRVYGYLKQLSQTMATRKKSKYSDAFGEDALEDIESEEKFQRTQAIERIRLKSLKHPSTICTDIVQSTLTKGVEPMQIESTSSMSLMQPTIYKSMDNQESKEKQSSPMITEQKTFTDQPESPIFIDGLENCADFEFTQLLTYDEGEDHIHPDLFSYDNINSECSIM